MTVQGFLRIFMHVYRELKTVSKFEAFFHLNNVTSHTRYGPAKSKIEKKNPQIQYKMKANRCKSKTVPLQCLLHAIQLTHQVFRQGGIRGNGCHFNNYAMKYIHIKKNILIRTFLRQGVYLYACPHYMYMFLVYGNRYLKSLDLIHRRILWTQ